MKLSKIKLHNKERLDDLIHDNLKIIQHKNHFSFGIDAVLLADFVDVKPGDKIIDLGTGTGVIPLLLTAKSDPGQVLGIELQAELVDMAKRSVLYNNLEEFIQIKRADITELKNQLRAESFELRTKSQLGVRNMMTSEQLATMDDYGMMGFGMMNGYGMRGGGRFRGHRGGHGMSGGHMMNNNSMMGW